MKTASVTASKKAAPDYHQHILRLLGEIKNGTVTFVKQDNKVIQINVTER